MIEQVSDERPLTPRGQTSPKALKEFGTSSDLEESDEEKDEVEEELAI